MTWRQRFVLGMTCAQDVLEIMIRTEANLFEPHRSTWSRSVDRLWIDLCLKHRDKLRNPEAYCRRGTRWLKWAGLVEIRYLQMLRSKGDFVKLTDGGRAAATMIHKERVLDGILAELGAM